ncbi:hypothetical protein VTN77DRAFT_2582 [Rasamsonia byssochlamydoides]|uniref:uncharacterized protein n=1 Tax=Rasamsonia byssochlamydoides TaxID=89139 RepID=UPI003743BEF9
MLESERHGDLANSLQCQDLAQRRTVADVGRFSVEHDTRRVPEIESPTDVGQTCLILGDHQSKCDGVKRVPEAKPNGGPKRFLRLLWCFSGFSGFPERLIKHECATERGRISGAQSAAMQRLRKDRSTSSCVSDGVTPILVEQELRPREDRICSASGWIGPWSSLRPSGGFYAG